MGKRRYRCTHEKACHVLWAVLVMGWTQTQAAIVVGLNVGTVSRIVHRKRFPNAIPKPIPGF